MNAGGFDRWHLARDIANSDAVLRVYAAPEWDCLSDDGKAWIVAIVEETRRRFAPLPVRRKVCRGNVKPAPFALTPLLVRRVLDVLASPPAGKQATLAVIDEYPFPRPTGEVGHTEPPRVALLEAAGSVPAETPNLGRPDTTPISKAANGPAAKIAPPIGAQATAADVRHRRAKDREARALETPVDVMVKPDRRAMIRQAAANLAARKEKIALPARSDPLMRPQGAPVARITPALPPFGPDLRRAALQAAIAFLKARCILVSPSDRDAQIRKYRVSGKAESKLAHEVIEIAVAMGFEVLA